MNAQPKVLALIPARSGSKSIKDKNIMSIGGKPMLAHSVDHARSSRLINRIVLSTDSEYYAEIGREHGAEIPFLRPQELASDDSTDLEVFLHALSFFKKSEGYIPEICVHLRPTCPIRDPKDIDKMIEILINNPEIDCVRSISDAPETPYKMWSLDTDGRMKPIIECEIPEAYNMPRQKLPKVYIQNASIDVIRTDTILNKGSMTGGTIHGYVMETFFDIDTYEQFEQSAKAIHYREAELTGKSFCFDIDGVIATLSPGNDYAKAQPIQDTIDLINYLYNKGNTIYLHTARGTLTGIDWRSVTEEQMRSWKVSYHNLVMGKPGADYYIDDRMIPLTELKELIKGEA